MESTTQDRAASELSLGWVDPWVGLTQELGWVWSDLVGSGQVGSGRVNSGRFGSGRVGLGWVELSWVEILRFQWVALG